MERKILILFTDQFPYGHGETFLENEMPFLAEKFTRVIIVPAETVSQVTNRALPDNVDVRCPNSPAGKSIVKTMAAFFGNRYILEEFLHNMFTNPLKNKVLLRSLAEACKLRDFVDELIADLQEDQLFFYTYWLSTAAISISLTHSGGVKISRAHGWDVYRERHLYQYLPSRKFMTLKLNGIFAISENGQKELQKQTGAKNIYLSRLGTHNPVPPDFTCASHASHLQLITIGNAIYLKRNHLVGEALQLLGKDKIKWVHFGDGPLLGQLKKDFPFATFKGWIGNNELKNELGKIAGNALLINTSTSEGIPVSMMEAMSFGIPCIGTKVGGVPEIIIDQYNGYLLKNNPEPEEIADRINDWLVLPGEQKIAMKKNAYSFWKENYNGEKNYHDFIDQMLRFKPI